MKSRHILSLFAGICAVAVLIGCVAPPINCPMRLSDTVDHSYQMHSMLDQAHTQPMRYGRDQMPGAPRPDTAPPQFRYASLETLSFNDSDTHADSFNDTESTDQLSLNVQQTHRGQLTFQVKSIELRDGHVVLNLNEDQTHNCIPKAEDRKRRLAPVDRLSSQLCQSRQRI